MQANKEVVYANSNRVGKFLVLHSLLSDDDARPLLSALFGLCVVLEVGEHECGRGKQYIASSDLFEELVEDQEIPTYRIEVALPGQAFKNPADEKDCVRAGGGFRFKAIRQNIVRVPPASISLQTPLPTRH